MSIGWLVCRFMSMNETKDRNEGFHRAWLLGAWLERVNRGIAPMRTSARSAEWV